MLYVCGDLASLILVGSGLRMPGRHPVLDDRKTVRS